MLCNAAHNATDDRACHGTRSTPDDATDQRSTESATKNAR
jgi:hypothetical protein